MDLVKVIGSQVAGLAQALSRFQHSADDAEAWTRFNQVTGPEHPSEAVSTFHLETFTCYLRRGQQIR